LSVSRSRRTRFALVGGAHQPGLGQLAQRPVERLLAHPQHALQPVTVMPGWRATKYSTR
jgi:hypothetical protein